MIEVFSFTFDPGPPKLCFRVTGPSGYLTAEIPKVYGIKGDNHTVTATVRNGSSTSSVAIAKNRFTKIGVELEGLPLLELVASGGPAATVGSDFPAVGSVVVGTPGRSGSRSCTGTVVDPLWVLTSAGCFTNTPASLTAGPPAVKSAFTAGGKTVDILEIVPRADRDLSLVRLSQALPGVTPMKLAVGAPAAAESLRVIGHGRTTTDWIPAKPHAATHTAGAITATTVDTVPASGSAAVCAGDAGAPLLREVNGSVEIAAVASRSWQGGCLDKPASETRTGAQSSRVDDIAQWITRTVSMTPSGTSVTGSPFTIVDPVDNHLVTYLRDSTAQLWSVDPQGEGWRNWGVYAAGDPTAVVNPANNHVVVYVNGPDNKLWSFDERDSNRWTEFTKTSSGTVLAPDAVPSTVVDPADGHLVTYIRDTANHLWSVDPQGEGWSDFGAMAAADPTAIAANGHVIVYVNGPNNLLYSVDQRGNGWTTFDKTPDGTVLAADNVPQTVVDPADGHLVTFVRDTRNVLWAVDPQAEGWTKYHGGPSAP
ncbi:trypsin-like serine protease [Kitasatospora sp. NPDC096147]|uniref:trypsin-like serine protease n=1 Tax=Kitasatospora sp. NPDC096147 TaxID=3364093 RepID=UPI00381095D1